ncbi:MAG: radical SAM protein [Methanobacteriota archaeon]|nr:MAG: radical SAM protein [Euryarchaeota archaeon]
MNAKEALPRYFRIFDGKESPYYLICKGVPVSLSSDSDSDVLWKEHEEKVREVRSAKGPSKVANPNLLDLKLELGRRLLNPCRLCERKCNVDRLAGEAGYCRVKESNVTSKFVHWGEEPELIPSYTIFFSRCTFECIFCQNWDISQRDRGHHIPPENLASSIEGMLGGVRNVNWVGGDPTPNLVYILEVLESCNASLPQVWNSNMYLTEKAMSLLDGITDLYLSDFKYGNDSCAGRLSRVTRYFEVVSRNHKIANEQCEIVLRHLVMPNHIECCTKPILKWISENLDISRIRVNVMDQYRPQYKARDFEGMDRRLSSKEFNTAYHFAEDLGLNVI